jgi:alkylhydroperoxidase/carboxymuconolactone decarboxylase family protein YurZ
VKTTRSLILIAAVLVGCTTTAPKARDTKTSNGPWETAALAQFREWDPVFVDQCLKMSNRPWTDGVLTHKEVELISLAVNCACTNQNAEGTRRHIRGALEAGASRDEILMVIRIGSLLSIHTASLGAPILLEEAKAAGVKPAPKEKVATPVCDKMKAAGQWNPAWDGFYEMDPEWTEAIIAASLPVYTSGVFTPRMAELLSIAVDASFTHMYAPGTRRHIKSAVKLGVKPEEIMEVLEICVAQGVQASNLGVPILAEELQRAQRTAEERK